MEKNKPNGSEEKMAKVAADAEKRMHEAIGTKTKKSLISTFATWATNPDSWSELQAWATNPNSMRGLNNPEALAYNARNVIRSPFNKDDETMLAQRLTIELKLIKKLRESSITKMLDDYKADARQPAVEVEIDTRIREFIETNIESIAFLLIARDGFRKNIPVSLFSGQNFRNNKIYTLTRNINDLLDKLLSDLIGPGRYTKFKDYIGYNNEYANFLKSLTEKITNSLFDKMSKDYDYNEREIDKYKRGKSFWPHIDLS